MLGWPPEDVKPDDPRLTKHSPLRTDKKEGLRLKHLLLYGGEDRMMPDLLPFTPSGPSLRGVQIFSCKFFEPDWIFIATQRSLKKEGPCLGPFFFKMAERVSLQLPRQLFEYACVFNL